MPTFCWTPTIRTTLLGLYPWDGAPGYMIRDRDRIYGGCRKLARFDARGPTSDLAALPNGTMLVNLTGANQVLLIDAERVTEIGRVPSSSLFPRGDTASQSPLPHPLR